MADFRRAIAGGIVEGETNLGYAYSKGLGLTKSDKSAALWYNKAAAAGDPTAQTALGWLYLHGTGVRRNAAAIHEFEIPANQGDADATASLSTVAFVTKTPATASSLTRLSKRRQ